MSAGDLLDALLWFLVILTAILAVPFTVVAPIYLQTRDRNRLYQLIREVVGKDQPISPELLRELVPRPIPSRERDVRRGLLLVGGSAGLWLLGAVFWFSGMSSEGPLFLALGSLPLCMGFTFLALGLSKRGSTGA